MKDEISVRQICFILIAYNAASKLLLYPTQAASAVGNALIFPALANLALQTVIIWSVAYLSSRTDKTFFGLLENTFGKVAARVIYAFFALYFLFAAIIPVTEQQNLVYDSFYDTMPSLLVFLPFFVFTVYAGVKSFANVGRCATICFPVFLVTVLSLLVMAFPEADFTNLAPVLKQPFSKLAGEGLAGIFRFSESAFLLMFIGHYKYKKGDAAKLTVSYAAGGLIIILFMAAYYAVYGNLAATRSFAISNIAAFFPAVNFVGRLDLFVVYALDLVVLFAIVLNVQMCVHCLCKVFDKEFRIIYSVVVNALLLVVMLLVDNKFTVLNKAANAWFWIPAVVFAYLIPVLCWALRRKNR